MNKLKELKEAIMNPPAERIVKVEYQSHFMQILGVLAVSSILIYRGYWYIIFAFIFSIGVSYSQGITAYRKYKMILNMNNTSYDPDQDKSPSRRRGYIIKSVFGKFPYWVSIIISLIITYLIVGIATWYQKLSFVFVVILFQVIIYFFIIYWVANPFYKFEKKLK